jgi:hypothetical protein
MSIDQFLLSADTTDLNFPEIRPTLDLNFSRTKTLDPRITFTRSSGGSYVGSDGLIKYAGVNQPRFDHDPVTGESLGLLVEENRTNLLTNTETFGGGWTKTNTSSITTNAITSPDGNLTAAKFNYNFADLGILRRTVGYTPSTTYTVSAFLKAAEIKYVIFLILDNQLGGISSMRINLVTGEFLDGVKNLPSTRTLTYYGNGWYRAAITFTTTINPDPNSYFDFRPSDVWPPRNIGSQINNPFQGQGFYIWGAQLEVGISPTSYIPTTTASRSRASEVALITGNNFLDIFNENEGVFYSKSKTFGAETETRFVGEVNTDPVAVATYVDILRYQNGRIRGIICPGVRDNCVVIESSFVSGEVYKSTHAYSLNKSILFVDGNRIGGINSTNRIVPLNLRTLTIGNSRPNGPFNLNGHIYHLMYYNRLLPENQLKALTL